MSSRHQNLHFSLLKEEPLLNEPWLKVTKNDYQLPDGKTLHDFYVVQEKNGVTIVPLTADGQIIIVKQFRPPVGVVTYDLPGGMVEPHDASPLKRAQHELVEETGYASTEWVELGSFFPAPHRMNNVQQCYLALNIEPVTNQKLDSTEFVDFELVTCQKLEDMIKRDEFQCAYCITAYFKAKLYLESKSITF